MSGADSPLHAKLDGELAANVVDLDSKTVLHQHIVRFFPFPEGRGMSMTLLHPISTARKPRQGRGAALSVSAVVVVLVATYSNEGGEVSRANVAGRVHVENGGAAAAGGPGLDAGAALEVKVAAVAAGQADAVVDVLRAVAGEGKGVGALALGALGDLGEANHVGVEDGEPVSCLLGDVLGIVPDIAVCLGTVGDGITEAGRRRTGSPGQTACSG